MKFTDFVLLTHTAVVATQYLYVSTEQIYLMYNRLIFSNLFTVVVTH